MWEKRPKKRPEKLRSNYAIVKTRGVPSERVVRLLKLERDCTLFNCTGNCNFSCPDNRPVVALSRPLLRQRSLGFVIASTCYKSHKYAWVITRALKRTNCSLRYREILRLSLGLVCNLFLMFIKFGRIDWNIFYETGKMKYRRLISVLNSIKQRE